MRESAEISNKYLFIEDAAVDESEIKEGEVARNGFKVREFNIDGEEGKIEVNEKKSDSIIVADSNRKTPTVSAKDDKQRHSDKLQPNQSE